MNYLVPERHDFVSWCAIVLISSWKTGAFIKEIQKSRHSLKYLAELQKSSKAAKLLILGRSCTWGLQWHPNNWVGPTAICVPHGLAFTQCMMSIIRRRSLFSSQVAATIRYKNFLHRYFRSNIGHNEKRLSTSLALGNIANYLSSLQKKYENYCFVSIFENSISPLRVKRESSLKFRILKLFWHIWAFILFNFNILIINFFRRWNPHMTALEKAIIFTNFENDNKF